jgi:hypothetical protein
MGLRAPLGGEGDEALPIVLLLHAVAKTAIAGSTPTAFRGDAVWGSLWLESRRNTVESRERECSPRVTTQTSRGSPMGVLRGLVRAVGGLLTGVAGLLIGVLRGLGSLLRRLL